MIRKRFNVIVSLVLIVAVSVTFLTGFIAAALDLNRFAYHKYAAYAAVLLVLIHVVLHWRSLAGQVRRWLLGIRMASPGPAAPQAVSPAPGPKVRGNSELLSPPARQEQRPRLNRRTLLQPGVLLAAGVGAGHWWASRGSPLALEAGEDLGRVYHQWSKPSYLGLLAKSLHVPVQPSPYKAYPTAPAVPLPPVPRPGGLPLEVAIARRRSIRDYGERTVTLAEVSRLLHYTTGVTDSRDPTLAFRAAPSSGALFPIEVYPVVFAVEGLPAGVYHYDVLRHRLELVRAGSFRQEVFHAALSQEMILRAALVLVLSGMFSRLQWKYMDRSYRYLLLEAGHLGQNAYLAATALGLGPCGIGAFFDDDLNGLLGVDGRDEAVVYLLAIGSLPG